MQVQSGESVLLPGGWPYAQVCLTDTLLLGAQLLHVHNLGLHVSVLTCCAPPPPSDPSLPPVLLSGAQLLHVHNLGLHVSVLTCSAPRPPTPLSPLSCCWGHSYCTYTTSA